MKYTYSQNPTDAATDNTYPWVVVMIAHGEAPVVEKFEFTKKEQAERFIEAINYTAQASAIRLYDKGFDPAMAQMLTEQT